MITLFHVPTHQINTAQFSSVLHDDIVLEFENKFKEYVGALHACSINSATNAIFLSLLNANETIRVSSIIPPVVLNAIIQSGNLIEFTDNVKWVGGSYTLHQFNDYKIIDSAQKVEQNQFKKEANPQDLMIFSFYPTKPISSCDGGIIVSNDKNKIDWLKTAVRNGTSHHEESWSREVKFAGWKMYMNSIQAFIALNNLKNFNKKASRLDEIRNEYNTQLGLNNQSGHLYRVSVDNNLQTQKNLFKLGIQCGIHYEATHHNQLYLNSSPHTRKSTKNADLARSTREESTTLSIPFHESLDKKDIQTIISTIQPLIQSHD